MKIELANTSRRPNWPLWAVALVLVWLAVGALTIFFSAYFGQPVQLCAFKGLTGFPCPTCGLTRGTLCLLHGQPGSAWLRNPFLFSFLGLFFLATLLRIIFARRLRIQLTNTQRRIVWVLVVAVFLVNWLYVILYVG